MATKMSEDREVKDPALAEPWRAVSIAELGLPRGVQHKLAENPDQAITTLGELTEWEDELAKKGIDNPLCWIPGIGAYAADKICEARVKWFRQHPPEKGEQD